MRRAGDFPSSVTVSTGAWAGPAESLQQDSNVNLRLSPLVLAAMVGLACNDPSSGPLNVPEFQVSPGVTWSGGTVTITSAFFIDRSIPVIRVDTLQLAVSRVDDSTVLATLPPLPSGTYPVFVSDDDLPGPIAEVELVGFRERRDISQEFLGTLITRQAPQGPVVIGTLGGGSHIGMLDLTSGLVTQFLDLQAPSGSGLYSVAPSYRGDNVFVLRDTAGIVGEWQLWPAPAFLDTVGSGFQNIFTRHVVTFGPDVYVVTGSHLSTSYSPAGNRFFTTESVWDNFLSPQGDRAVLASNVGMPGIQVFDMATGDTAYTLPVHSSVGVAFTADGSLLFATGGEYYNHNNLMRLDASTGAVLERDSVLDGSYQYKMALSQSESRLYVAAERDSFPHLRVYDATTLALIADLVVPTDERINCWSTCWEGVVSLDEATGTVFYTVPSTFFPGVPARVYVFDILPE